MTCFAEGVASLANVSANYAIRESVVTGSPGADLYTVRGDVHFIRQWDALVEARELRVNEADDRRAGYLLAIYRHMGNHMKLGAGYNFTDFSDDLTDLSYRSRGPFLNILGTL